MKTVLVTGGAGFIGSHLVDELLEQGFEVVVLDNLSTGRRSQVPSKAIFIEGDIRDDLSSLFSTYSFDSVFHLAAQASVSVSVRDPVEDARVNIIGALNVVHQSFLSGVKHITFVSSAAVYSPHAPLPCTEQSPLAAGSPYGLAKMTIERYLELYHVLNGLSYTVLRLSNVYGPRQTAHGEAGVISVFVHNALQRKQLMVFGDGTQTRDFVYVKDVVRALVLSRTLNGIYNVSTGKQTSLLDLIAILSRLIQTEFSVAHHAARAGELKHSALSSAALQKEGWKSQYSLEQGLGETVEDYRNA